VPVAERVTLVDCANRFEHGWMHSGRVVRRKPAHDRELIPRQHAFDYAARDRSRVVTPASLFLSCE
jgi:hypothetical protein